MAPSTPMPSNQALNTIISESHSHRSQAVMSLPAPLPKSEQLATDLDMTSLESDLQQSLTMISTDSSCTQHSKASDSTCHFFRLAAELRNQIYEEALPKDGSVFVVTFDSRQTTKADDYTEPALLRVCRRIRAEAGPIYLSNSTLQLRIVCFDPSTLTVFCKKAEACTKKIWPKIEVSIRRPTDLVKKTCTLDEEEVWLRGVASDELNRSVEDSDKCYLGALSQGARPRCCLASRWGLLVWMVRCWPRADWSDVKDCLSQPSAETLQREYGNLTLKSAGMIRNEALAKTCMERYQKMAEAGGPQTE